MIDATPRIRARHMPYPVRDADIWVSVEVVVEVVAVSVGPRDVITVGVGANPARQCRPLVD